MALHTLRTHVLILSQSCDLERAADSAAGRVLLAPITAEEKTPLLVPYRENLDQGVALKVAISKGDQVKGAVKKKAEKADALRLDLLKKVWLGEAGGVFPIAEIRSAEGSLILERAVCHFDLAISVPRDPWFKILREERVARLTDSWRSVLREGLSQWVGRFAFPGTNNDRLMVGLSSLLPKSKAPGASGE